MKSLKEQIEVMQHFLNGGDIETKLKSDKVWFYASSPTWDWYSNDYRIKEKQKDKIVIEKWLFKDTINNEYFEYSSSQINIALKNFAFSTEKIKLLDTYEVEL